MRRRRVVFLVPPLARRARIVPERDALSGKYPGSLFLFDIQAAFPSLSHEYTWAILAQVGVPPSFLSGIQKLYVHNTH